MTENDIKEAISKDFVSSIAHYKGLAIDFPEKDYGEDLILNEIIIRNVNGGERYSPSGRRLVVQLKSTTEKNINVEDNVVSYSLEAKTYNDLVTRRNSILPLFLFLFILPDDKTQWLALEEEQLLLKKQAFWFIPDASDQLTQNTQSVTVKIPFGNLIQIDTLSNLLDIAY